MSFDSIHQSQPGGFPKRRLCAALDASPGGIGQRLLHRQWEYNGRVASSASTGIFLDSWRKKSSRKAGHKRDSWMPPSTVCAVGDNRRITGAQFGVNNLDSHLICDRAGMGFGMRQGSLGIDDSGLDKCGQVVRSAELRVEIPFEIRPQNAPRSAAQPISAQPPAASP